MLANLRAFVAVLLSDALTAAGLLSDASDSDNKHRPSVSAGGLRARAYPLIVEAVEAGVAYGWRRAWKHRDGEPGEDAADPMREEIEQAVVDAICERFDFDDAET